MQRPHLFIGCIRAMDAALVASGFPATSPWWQSELERFVLSGRKRWVIRAGRRAGKSSTLCRVAVAVALWGEWSVPIGDRAVVAFVSVDRDEAASRLRTIAAILGALEVPHEERAGEIALPERRLVFKVITGSVKGTAGFTSIAVFGDEMAKWESRDDHANPAREVMASLRPTMATQAAAFEVCASSPWGKSDYHAELFNLGDDDHQVASFAPTWVGNPTLTEEDTRAKEPDLRIWSREYAAIPAEESTSDWFGVALDMALSQARVDEGVLPWVRYTIAIDPAFHRDFFGYAVISSRSLPPDPRMPHRKRRMTRVHEAGAWKVNGRRPLEMAFELRRLCQRYHVGAEPQRADELDSQAEERIRKATARVFSDQYEGHSFGDLARQAGLYLEVRPWTGGQSETSQGSRYKAVRLAMLEGTLLLPADSAPTGDVTKSLESELRAVRGVLLPSGNERIELPRASDAGHLDRTSALVLAASEALLLPAQDEQVVPVKIREQDAWREEAKRKVIERRAKEWKRDPMGALRRASR